MIEAIAQDNNRVSNLPIKNGKTDCLSACSSAAKAPASSTRLQTDAPPNTQWKIINFITPQQWSTMFDLLIALFLVLGAPRRALR